ncbi:MAG: hypothetical protein V3U27_22590, partial [Candidatus Tectomicrobia bacterium]
SEAQCQPATAASTADLMRPLTICESFVPLVFPQLHGTAASEACCGDHFSGPHRPYPRVIIRTLVGPVALNPPKRFDPMRLLVATRLDCAITAQHEMLAPRSHLSSERLRLLVLRP